MPTISLNCPNCGAPLPDPTGRITVVCAHCQSVIKLRGLQPPPEQTQDPAEPSNPLQLSPLASVTRLPPEALASIRESLARDRKVEAVQTYRQATGSDLRDALSAVEAIQAGLRESPGHSLREGGRITAPPPPGPKALAAEARLGRSTAAEVRRLLESRNRIAAIKLYRDVTGAGLKEARDDVEALEDMWGLAMPSASRARQAGASAGPRAFTCSGLVLGILAFIMLIFAGCGAYLQTKPAYQCSMRAVTAELSDRQLFGESVRGGYLVLSPGFEENMGFGSWRLQAEFFAPVWGSDGLGVVYVRVVDSSSGSPFSSADVFKDWQRIPLLPWGPLTCS